MSLRGGLSRLKAVSKSDEAISYLTLFEIATWRSGATRNDIQKMRLSSSRIFYFAYFIFPIHLPAYPAHQIRLARILRNECRCLRQIKFLPELPIRLLKESLNISV